MQSDDRQIIKRLVKSLEAKGSAKTRESQARFGVAPSTTRLGVTMIDIRAIAKASGLAQAKTKNQAVAMGLWATDIHESRILASLIADPKQMTRRLMDQWASDFDAWDVCDQVCGNLFHKSPFAYDKTDIWSRRQAEFAKRAAFSLMAYLACHDKKAPDDRFVAMLALIEAQAEDDRNFVKKAVNWALRGIGKRNMALHTEACGCARRLSGSSDRTARWIAADALRELESEKIVQRLKRSSG